MRNILDVERTNKESIMPGENVTFNIASPYSEGIGYNSETGEIIFQEIGKYSIRWWVATETSLIGCIQFALKTSQQDLLIGCSPAKSGQLVGFGAIDVRTPGITASLVNNGEYPVFLSKTSPVTSALLAMRIPEDATFAVSETSTLEPGEPASANVQVDDDDPDHWLFSFGIPKGETGDPGITPHIDTETGNWFIGETDTGVQAQGPIGDRGPTAATIPFSVTNGQYSNGVRVATDTQGNPEIIDFIGFGNSGSYDSYRFSPGDWDAGVFSIDISNSYPSTFVMPYKAVLKNIHLVFANREPMYINTGITMYPFVFIAVSNSTNLIFTILKETITYTEPYVGTEEEPIPKYSLRKGALRDLEVEIDEGTLVAIVVGWKGEGVTMEQTAQVSVSGGLFFE